MGAEILTPAPKLLHTLLIVVTHWVPHISENVLVASLPVLVIEIVKGLGLLNSELGAHLLVLVFRFCPGALEFLDIVS